MSKRRRTKGEKKPTETREYKEGEEKMRGRGPGEDGEQGGEEGHQQRHPDPHHLVPHHPHRLLRRGVGGIPLVPLDGGVALHGGVDVLQVGGEEAGGPGDHQDTQHQHRPYGRP